MNSVIDEEKEIQTSKMNNKADRLAEMYMKKYRPYIEKLESKSMLSKLRGITTHDIYSLGKMLESWEDYKAMMEETGSVSQLGTIPNVAMDVITVAYGTAPISTLASVQPIDEERGMVYFKEVKTVKARGDIAAGSKIALSDRAPEVFHGSEGPFTSDRIKISGGNTGAANLGPYSTTVPPASRPIRPQKVVVQVNLDAEASTVPDTVTLRDLDGDGKLLSSEGATGTVDYQTGIVAFTFATDHVVVGGDAISIWVSTDFEDQEEIPTINTSLVSKPVDARIWALRNTVGLAQSYAMKKRFGMVAEDELATDLIASINAEISRVLITLLSDNAQGNVNWSRTAPSGISFYEHKQTFKDALATAESTMLGNAGRGTISTLVAGRKACEIIGTLPGFVKMSDGSTINTHIYGTLDGATVVRVPYNTVLDNSTVLCVYKGTSPFEAAAVYSPYMPLIVTDTITTGANPLLNQKAAAVWAAVESLVPNFVTKLTVTST
jgi:hypothetical protein